MKPYRFKHIATGLYYIPNSEKSVYSTDRKRFTTAKSNLSKHGKIYQKNHTIIGLTGGSFYNHTIMVAKLDAAKGEYHVYGLGSPLTRTTEAEWVKEEL